MREGCKPFMERLCEALGEDLSNPLCRELKEHLAECPNCTLQVDTIKRTVEIYRLQPMKLVPGDVEERLHVRLNLPPAKSTREERP